MRGALLLGATSTGGAAAGHAFPDATTTGPAAGGYTSLTPVTGAAFSWQWNHTDTLPSYVALQPDGSYLVENIAFGAGTSIGITLASLKFRGCSFNCAPNGIAITFTGPSTAVATGSNGGDVTTLTSLAVTDAGGMPAGGGTVAVYTAASGTVPALVNYTGKSSNALTGCTYVSETGTGTVSSVPPVSAVRLQSGAFNVEYCSATAPDTTPANRMHAAVAAGSSASPVTIDHCDFRWWEQAVQTALTTTITNSFFHDPVYAGPGTFTGYAGDHTEPIEIPGGTTVSMSNCTLLNSLTDLANGGGQTAVVAGSTNPSSYQLDHCLVGGGGYVFYTYSAATSIRITNCAITTQYFASSGQFGLFNPGSTFAWGGVNGNVWSGNTWYDGPNAGLMIAAP